MRKLLFCVAVLAAAWGFDTVVFDGRYGRAAGMEAKFQGQNFYHQVNRWWRRYVW